MSEGKIQKTLRDLTKDQNRSFGSEIEILIKTDMKYAVNKLIRDYSYIMQDTFGWTKDDLLQNIRIRMWRGLATFDETKKIKKTSYLAAVLQNHFLSLLRMCRAKKNAQSKFICVPDMAYGNEDLEMFANDSPEDSINMDTYDCFLNKMSSLQRIVFDLTFVDGYQPAEIVSRTKITRRQVDRTIEFIKRAMERFDVTINEEVENGTKYNTERNDKGTHSSQPLP